MWKLMGVCGPRMFPQLDICISIVYIMPTIGECMSVGEYIEIGYVEIVGCLWALCAQCGGMYVSWCIP